MPFLAQRLRRISRAPFCGIVVSKLTLNYLAVCAVSCTSLCVWILPELPRLSIDVPVGHLHTQLKLSKKSTRRSPARRQDQYCRCDVILRQRGRQIHVANVHWPAKSTPAESTRSPRLKSSIRRVMVMLLLHSPSIGTHHSLKEQHPN